MSLLQTSTAFYVRSRALFPLFPLKNDIPLKTETLRMGCSHTNLSWPISGLFYKILFRAPVNEVQSDKNSVVRVSHECQPLHHRGNRNNKMDRHKLLHKQLQNALSHTQTCTNTRGGQSIDLPESSHNHFQLVRHMKALLTCASPL